MTKPDANAHAMRDPEPKAAGPQTQAAGTSVASAPGASAGAVANAFGTGLQAPETPSGLAVIRLDALDREFLPAALELLETPPSPIRVAAIWVICAGLVVALAWSYFGKLDIHAVAQGRIQPSGRSKVVQPLEPGKILSIAVENGSRVRAGDVLIELDPTESGADRDAQARDLESARAEAARRKVAVAAARGANFDAPPIPFTSEISETIRRREESVMAADLAQLASTRAGLMAQLAERDATRERLSQSIVTRERLIALAKERVNMRETLKEQGSLSRAMVIELLQQYETQISQLVGEKGQLIETEAQLKTVETKIEEAKNQFIADQSQKLAEAERKADRLTQELIKAKTKNDRATLKAPIDGVVQQLMVTTVGQVVSSGQSLMTIVPTGGPIEIEALIQNQDIGFVEAGQDVIIKVELFPFTRYGTIDGKVLRVSHDAVDEREAMGMSDPNTAARQQGSATASAPARSQSLVFPATINLAKRSMNIDGKEIALTAGMAVTVEVLTGQRRAIDYVLSPLREVASRTAHER